MATISGKRFQITDGAASPTNLFPYTVTEAVYGLSAVINTAKSDVTNALTAVTLNGVSKAGTTASFYAPTTAGTTGQILKATTSGAPVWTSAALGASNKPIYLNSSGVLTEGVSCITQSSSAYQTVSVTSTSSDYALAVKSGMASKSYLRFDDSSGLLGWLGVESTNGAVYITSGGSTRTILHSGNYSSYALPLTAGSSYPLTGNLYIATTSEPAIVFKEGGTDVGHVDASSTLGVRLYHPGSGYPSIAIKPGVAYPVFRYNSTDYTVYHSGNSNKSDVAWACSTLTANSEVIAPTITAKSDTYPAVTFADSTQARWIFSKRSTASDLHLIRYTSSQTYDTVMAFAYSSGNVGIGTTSPSQKLDVSGNINLSGFIRLAAGQAVHALYNGYADKLIEVDASGINHLCYGGSNGVLQTRIYGNGITFYNNSRTSVASLSTTGVFSTTGDQVVSSDLTLKENLTPVTYSVSDIAKARAVEFDWRDGRGHSMGSIAQDWLSIAPALVHGEEGNMSLAYGQLALVNTILLARQSESHEERIAKLERENAELKAEVERLRMS